MDTTWAQQARKEKTHLKKQPKNPEDGIYKYTQIKKQQHTDSVTSAYLLTGLWS